MSLNDINLLCVSSKQSKRKSKESFAEEVLQL